MAAHACFSDCRYRPAGLFRSRYRDGACGRDQINMENPLKKIALVTGANKGIGFEVARQLAASGCSVLLGARNRALGEKAAATLKREGCDVRYLSIDLDDPATIATAAKDIDAGFGHLDILVNNAGIAAQGDG